MSTSGDRDDPDDLRAALAEERSRVLVRMAALRRDLDRIVEAAAGVATDDEHDPDGTTAFERAQTQSLLDASVAALPEIDAALARLDAGTYGRCARCGEEIPAARSVARPVARTCVACASRR